MPLPFIVGGIIAAKAVLATTVAKVAIGVAAGAIISRAFTVKVTVSTLKEDIGRVVSKDEKLRRKKQLEARITNILETGDFPIIKVGLYEDGNHLEEVEAEAKKGIDRNEIYVGRSWMVYS